MIHIVDMDGTLVYPSPYGHPTFLAMSLAEQKRLAETDEFLEKLIDAPEAPWLDNRFGNPDDYLFIVTGRWEHTNGCTIEWLRKHLQREPDRIINVRFNSAAQYTAEKVGAIKAVASMAAWRVGAPVDITIYEDDKNVLFQLENYYQDAPNFDFVEVRDGFIVEPIEPIGEEE